MLTKYQIAILGADNIYIDDILKRFFFHISELGISKDAVLILDETNFTKEYKANAPVFCLYFGNALDVQKHIKLLETLINDASLILPVVSSLKNYTKSTPSQLHSINGFELGSYKDIELLVNCVLEGLGLLRSSRRLFISYKRDESSGVAIQLFEQLEKNGFDVFLDTHSIRPGEVFQNELWHRLADTDVVVLLNTDGFLKSSWTTQELAQANAMCIGILQIIWPSHAIEREAALSISMQLTDIDFTGNNYSDSKSTLVAAIVKEIVSQTESLRARSLASRQDNIITEFMSTAANLGKSANLQPERFITINNKHDKEVIIIPTVGVPQALTYNQSKDFVERIKKNDVEEVFILFDHRNIQERWIKHLAWLDKYLPVKTIKIIESLQWLRNN